MDEIQAGIQLSEGCDKLGLNLSDDVITQLVHYLRLLNKWNQAYNLTAITDLKKQVSLHLLDSLSVIPYLKANRIIDIGTGAGLPGIPLALALPDKHFTLLDSNGKKTRFLRHAVYELELDNVDIAHSRMEKFIPDEKYDGIISRALSKIQDTLINTSHLCSASGKWFFLKGAQVDEEIAGIDKDYQVTEQHRLKIPGFTGLRHLVCVQQRKK